MDKQRDIKYMYQLAAAIKETERWEYEKKTKECFAERPLHSDNGCNRLDNGADNSQQISLKRFDLFFMKCYNNK